MKSLPMQFVPAKDYFEMLMDRVPLAKKRVIIHAMVIVWGAYTEQLLPLLIAAADRGVEVRIIGDVYSKIQAIQPRFSRASLPSWKHTIAISSMLRTRGIHVTYTGSLGINPFARRTHSKVTIIDDQVFTFGGVNFADDAFENTDYMLAIKDEALANMTYDLVRTIERDKMPAYPNRSEILSEASTLLFDGGVPHDSIIYKTACRLAASAKKIYYVSQMCPSGDLARAIVATSNECYFIRPGQTEFPSNIALLFDVRRWGITNLYQGQKYIHAKFMLTEDKDGTRHVISGSNNFSWRGVAYGTKEIAVHSTDSALWQAFYDFMQQEIVKK